MRNHTWISASLAAVLGLAPLVGCSSLPGRGKGQGAVIGGVGGALAGAALSKNERGLGALIGGVLGAGGGYLIGAQKDKVDDKKRDEATAAHERAQRTPARPEDVERSRTADLNDDGFVTLDEVVAMERANLGDREMVDRLQRTDQVFELTEEQERYLEDRGVSREVVIEMRQMNQSLNARTASAAGDASGREQLRQRNGDQYRVRENDRPRDFNDIRAEVRQSERSGARETGNRDRF